MSRILVGLLLLGATVSAQPAEGIPVPIRIVAGRLMVRCDVSSPARRIPAHLLVELSQPFGLQMHPRSLRPLRIAPGSPLTLHFPGLKFETKAWTPSGNEPYRTLTRRYAPELNEIAVIGSIGAGVLRQYHLVFDLAAGVLRIGPPKARSEERPANAIAVEFDKDRIRLPLRFAGDKSGWILLATSQFDTFFDAKICRQLGHPAGDIGPVRIGPLDIAPRVALRPGKLAGSEPAATGLNLFEGLRVTVDRTNGYVLLEETKPARFPAADLAYFGAEAQPDADPIEAWLVANSGSRLASEAAALLLARRLRDEAEDEVAGRAVKFVIETEPEDLRATKAWELMPIFEEEDRNGLMLIAAELGLPTGRKDRDAQAVYKLHSRMGEVYLAEGEKKKAWRHLLSAAFGYPDHGPTNYWLGRFYEQEGRLTRAFSRYLQAAIQEETTRLGMDGLERVQGKLATGERLDVETVEKLISGKVPAFTAPDRFEEEEKTRTNRVVLAELFTHSHVVPSLAADLAFDGLLSHFPRERLAVLVHHISSVGADGLASAASDQRAAQLGITRPGTAVFDGKRKLDLLGRDEHVEDRYRKAKGAVRAAIKKPTDYKLTIEAKVDGNRVSGKVVADGPAAERWVTIYLVEKGVVFAGRSKIVVHHMVVRDRLADTEYEPGAAIPFAIDLEGRTKGGLRQIPVDPQRLAVVAIVRGSESTRIYQAAYGEPTR
ncbi:MAG: hypothetical protein ACYTEG_09225 [Planctomycetota bacterium]|jgi:tetratricopeptide (TPR) repeat protein